MRGARHILPRYWGAMKAFSARPDLIAHAAGPSIIGRFARDRLLPDTQGIVVVSVFIAALLVTFSVMRAAAHLILLSLCLRRGRLFRWAGRGALFEVPRQTAEPVECLPCRRCCPTSAAGGHCDAQRRKQDCTLRRRYDLTSDLVSSHPSPISLGSIRAGLRGTPARPPATTLDHSCSPGSTMDFRSHGSRAMQQI